MLKINKLFFALYLFTACSTAFSMVYDNRYFPLYGRTYSRTKERPSAFIPDIFITTANSAFEDDEDSSGIPEIFGIFDQNKLANAIELIKGTNPLQAEFPQLIGRKIKWGMDGKIESQGVAFGYHQQLTDYLSFGASWFFMHVFSRINFDMSESERNSLNLSPEQVVALDGVRRSMFDCVGLEAPKWNRSGISDIDLYFRFGTIWDYLLKFRRIDAGVRAGILIPSGITRDVFNPAAVPFGGNGHWGMYCAGDIELEFMEDWKFGCLVRFSQRFNRTRTERLPIAKEQPLFGAVAGKTSIDPGYTFIFSPYLRLEDIRDGLGVQVRYTVIAHGDDLIRDKRENPANCATLELWNNRTNWTSEYLTFNVFYDFARVRQENCNGPIVSLMWDLPVQFYLTERVSKTYRVSFGVKFNF